MACRILVPEPGMETAPSALEGKVLTTGPPGKSLKAFLFLKSLKNKYIHEILCVFFLKELLAFILMMERWFTKRKI